VEIFERGRKPVLVTPAGREILRRARVVLTAVEELQEAARCANENLSGRLCLGVIPTVAPYPLPAVLPAVRRAYPDLRLELYEAHTESLVDRLERGELDLLLVALEAPLGDVSTLPLFGDDFLLAVPAEHRLAGRARIKEADLAGEAVLLLEDGHCLRSQALAVCSRAGASELGDFGYSSLGTLIAMVAGGAGVTLLPAMAAHRWAELDSDLRLVPFVKPVPMRTIGFAWRRTSPREHVFKELAELFKRPTKPKTRRVETSKR
jgi:LysR family hydrogen peroxide-inducible transcriptional activator